MGRVDHTAKGRLRAGGAPVVEHDRAPTLTPALRDHQRALRMQSNVWALATFVLCAILGFTARDVLNPDGVSYLDVARAMRLGAWDVAVQGYWSPLYPAMVAILSWVTRLDGPALVPSVHALNVLIASGSIAGVWMSLRDANSAVIIRLSYGALLIAGLRPPRLDAVTPDLLLMAIMVIIANELTTHRGQRSGRIGFLMGVAFLAKTSTWPWLLALVLMRLVVGVRTRRTKSVIVSGAVCVAVAAVWIVPLSIVAKRFTVGDAARLNACWYLRSCDSRSPDTHTGEHRSYRFGTMPDGTRLTWAVFAPRADATPPKLSVTYTPWYNPGEWDRDVVTRSEKAPSLSALLKYSATLAAYVFGFWHLPLWIVICLPAAVIGIRGTTWRQRLAGRPETGVTIAAGLTGLGQFIAVHAEPRLTAPFALMFALGMLALVNDEGTLPAQSEGHGRLSAKWASRISWAWLVVAVPFTIVSVRENVDMQSRIIERGAAIRDASASQSGQRLRQPRIVVIGTVFPVLADVYRVHGTIVAQILPASAQRFGAYSRAQQATILVEAFGGSADFAWITNIDGTFRVMSIGSR